MTNPAQWIGTMIASVFLAGGCQTSGGATPATLSSLDEDAIGELKSVLADAMGKVRIELGPDDPTQTSSLSVLPPRLGASEDRSTARPVIFDIMKQGGRCYVVRRDTGEEFSLGNIACVASP